MTLAQNFAGLWRQYIKAAVQSGGVAAAGDLTAQCLRSGGASADSVGAGVSIDQRRTASIGTFQCLYNGLITRFVFRRFDTLFGMQTSLTIVSKKVALDTFTHTPLLYLPCFLVATPLLQGKSLTESVDRLCVNYVDTLMATCTIWPLAVFTMFRFISEPNRIVFLSFASFALMTCNSLIQLKNARKGTVRVSRSGQSSGTEDTRLLDERGGWEAKRRGAE